VVSGGACVKEKRALPCSNARFLAALWGTNQTVRCPRSVNSGRRRRVRLLREAALALGFADVAHGAVEVGVRAVSRVSDHAVDDERSLSGERGDLLVARDAFVFELRFGFGDCGLGIERILDGGLVAGVAGDAAELHGRGELRRRGTDYPNAAAWRWRVKLKHRKLNAERPPTRQSASLSRKTSRSASGPRGGVVKSVGLCSHRS
jgi:hypothetical protein